MVNFTNLRIRYVQEVRDSILDQREINPEFLNEFERLDCWSKKVMEAVLVEYVGGLEDYTNWLGEEGFQGRVDVARMALQFYREKCL